MSNGFSSGFVYEWNEKRWKDFVKRIQKNVNKDKIDKILNAVSQEGVKTVVGKMPKKPKGKGFVTGQTANKWFAKKLSFGKYQIYSTSKVALFLEQGTRAHGPKTAKFLYIPLRKNALVWRKGMIFGKDYILAKRVKGIDAMHYLEPTSNEILEDMVNKFVLELVKI